MQLGCPVGVSCYSPVNGIQVSYMAHVPSVWETNTDSNHCRADIGSSGWGFSTTDRCQYCYRPKRSAPSSTIADKVPICFGKIRKS